MENIKEFSINNWKQEWNEMPEYNNIKEAEPEVVVTVRFATTQDFEEFKEKLKILLNTTKPFDGMQRKKQKSILYPPRDKASNYICQ